MPRPALLLIASTLALLISACGLKGDLYLPEQPATPVVITAPGQSGSSSSAASSTSSTQP